MSGSIRTWSQVINTVWFWWNLEGLVLFFWAFLKPHWLDSRGRPKWKKKVPIMLQIKLPHLSVPSTATHTVEVFSDLTPWSAGYNSNNYLFEQNDNYHVKAYFIKKIKDNSASWSSRIWPMISIISSMMWLLVYLVLALTSGQIDSNDVEMFNLQSCN